MQIVKKVVEVFYLAEGECEQEKNLLIISNIVEKKKNIYTSI